MSSNKFAVTILWGRTHEDDDKPVTYTFATEAERVAFMEGVDSAVGWLDHEIVSVDDQPTDPIPTGPSLTDALKLIWTKLYGYQEEMIPFEKYEDMAQACRAGDAMYPTYRATADAYREEWDDICHHMALIHEALGISQEDC